MDWAGTESNFPEMTDNPRNGVVVCRDCIHYDPLGRLGMIQNLMDNFPTGTVTFLLTDIEGSTALWEQFPDAMQAAMSRHDALIETVVREHSGQVVRPRGEGDSRFAVFEQARNAVLAIGEIQRAFAVSFPDLPFQLRVRAGLHTGAADWRDGDYYGSTVNRCARIRGLAHGGQTLLSQATAALVADDLPHGVTLVEMGTHLLKGLSRPELVHQMWLDGLRNDFPALQSAEGFLGNLPKPPTAIIGRERERNDIMRFLADTSSRLVTLTGPGGMGKTRLSLEIGHRLHNRFRDGSFFVDLSPIGDPALVMTTIAHTLGIREGGGRPPFDNLKDYLADKEALIILDNLEQVIGVAPLVAQLMAAAPRIKLLATSRIPLQIRGEREYPLGTLPVPPMELLPLEVLREYEVVQLFIDRAQAARPSFEMTAENAAAVAGICRRLDGLPLAIELAAARIRMLPPAALFKRLDQSIALLVGGAADLPARQQTMRGAIDWSFDLLPAAEQTLFARLGVFVGGFSLEHAETIVNFDKQLDVFTGVETLLHNSLIRQVDSVTGDPRFEMLQTIRDYALEKLAQSGELMGLQRRHAEEYAQEALTSWNLLGGPQAIDRLAYLEEEHDNYRAAISWGLEPGNDVLVACQICVFHAWFWYRHGHFHEGRDWTQKVLGATRGLDNLARGMSLNAAGMMAMWQGDLIDINLLYEEALQLVEKLDFDLGKTMVVFSFGIALLNQGHDREAHGLLMQAAERFDQAGDSWDKTNTLIHLANASLGLGYDKQAESWLMQALPLAERIGDTWQIAFCLNNFGEVARVQGNYERARGYYQRSEALYRSADAVGDHARLIHTLGYMALHDGDPPRAQGLFLNSLASFRKLGNKRGMAECLSGLAAVAAVRGDAVWAVPVLAAAEAQIVSSGARWWPADRVEVERTRQQLKAALDDAEFDRLWRQGWATSLDTAVARTHDHAE